MHLKFALVALLALTGLTGPAPRVVDALAGPGAPVAAARDAMVDTAVPTRTGAAGDGGDGVNLEEKSIVVPPVESAVAETPSASPSEAAPEPQANPDVVVADQLVSAERVESEVVDAAGFQTIGVTWPEGAEVGDLGGQVRTQTDGTWSEWIDLQPGDDAPDAGTADAANAVRGGTDPVSIGDADAVQLAFNATPDGGPAGLSLALVGSAETSASDRVVGTAANGKATIQSASFTTGMLKTAAAPRVISRAEWGAPAQVCAPDVASKLVGAVVHHTAGSNSYSSVAEAMQQIRNDAAYHISGRGWCDIGYNFIVDKWGNIYEGRANSMTQAVIGVHTGGFNTGTLGSPCWGPTTRCRRPRPSREWVRSSAGALVRTASTRRRR
ncbi:N-acetylmuramoyl-L-alanine amidase [Pengzhenrongella phosphoraccumulans]|uniref:N-acetylmuramoyl-L-alanine amidase n=1 Tax=Pengzhenrongella phosphoraccumulans TaxID=3114394 RepID=UPI00388EB999